MIRLVAILALLLAAQAAQPNSPFPEVARFSAGSRRACRLDLDCGPGNYCPEPTAARPISLCRPLPGRNAPCKAPRSGANHCRPGLFCFFERTTPPLGRTCRPQAGRGDACSAVDRNSCARGLACDRRSKTCRMADRVGQAGARCFGNGDCAANAGLYCRSSDNKCRNRKKAGEPCARGTDTDDCQGFCRPGGPFVGEGRCVNGIPLGGFCLSDAQCAGARPAKSGGDRTVCNGGVDDDRDRGTRKYGRCAKYSALKKRLGDACNQKNDLCDAGRGLSCVWSPTDKKALCQHRYPAPGRYPLTYCGVGSKYSTCPSADQVCRRLRAIPGRPKPDFFPQCYPRTETVPLGARCDIERARCPSGSECRAVSGVERRVPGKPSSSSRARALYCVTVVTKAGDACADKFVAQCARGLVCKSGKCATGRAPRTIKATHADKGGRCDKLPCAPGLKCTAAPAPSSASSSTPKTPICKPPTVIVPLFASCGVMAERERACGGGMVCRTLWSGMGLRLCRWPQSAGAFCERNSWCARGLKCAIVTAAGRFAPDHRCYDPKKALEVGEKCDPAKQLLGPRCRPAEAEGGRAVRCLAKGGGFECQIVAGLFGKCGAEGVSCGDWRLQCASDKVCMPLGF